MEKPTNVSNNVDRLSDDTLVSDNNINSKILQRDVTPVKNSEELTSVNKGNVQKFEDNSDSQRSYHSTEDSNKSDSQNEKSGIYLKNKKANQSRVLSLDNCKGSNLTRHLSQLSLADNLRAEIPSHTRKCNVVYHYATMQLNFSPEMEKFVQSIVST